MAEDAVQKALAQIAELDAKSDKLKRWINDYDLIEGNEPRFPNVGDASVAMTGGGIKSKGRAFTPGQFFNKPFAGAVKSIMIASSQANGNQPAPMSVDDIHEALMQGSFGFETNGADAQKNSIKISLGKNSVTFVKLPNSDLFGLAEWYGKKPKRTRLQMLTGQTEAEDDDAGDGDDAGDTAAVNDGYFTNEPKQAN